MDKREGKRSTSQRGSSRGTSRGMGTSRGGRGWRGRRGRGSSRGRGSKSGNTPRDPVPPPADVAPGKEEGTKDVSQDKSAGTRKDKTNVSDPFLLPVTNVRLNISVVDDIQVAGNQ